MLEAIAKPFALSLVIAQAACAGALAEPFTPPESGGAPWTEVTSKHVVLRTDLPADEARDACIEFERIHAMFDDIAFPYREKSKVRTSILLFRREAEYRTVGPRNSAGYFHRALAVDDYFEPMAIFYGDLTAATRLTFQHELTHRFIDFYFPKAPVWLHEGMADYYSTMQIEDNHVVLGRDLPNRFFIRSGLTWTFESTPMWDIAHVPIDAAQPVQELVAMDREDFYAARREWESPTDKEQGQKAMMVSYASAWALVHLLLNGPAPYPELFQAYLEKLATGVDPDSAWSEAFGAVDEKLQNDYQAWLAPKDRILRRSPYELPAAAAVSERPMSPSDVHVLWASIRPWSSDAHRARARADLDAAIQLDPKHVPARVWMAQLDEAEGRVDDAEKNLNAALAAAPDDPTAIYALFRLLVRQTSQAAAGQSGWERMDAMLPKVLAVASSTRVQNGAARYLALRNRTDEGLPLALRAVKGEPSCWQCFDTLALLLSQKGAFEKAKEAQTIAVSLVPEGLKNAVLTERLQRYEAAAGSQSTARPAPSAEALGELDRSAAGTALGKAATDAKKCMQPGGPTGTGKIRVVFEPSGGVSTVEVLGAPFGGSPTGDCIAGVFDGIRIPPFKGSSTVAVTKSFSIP